jgi:hypothetical protein
MVRCFVVVLFILSIKQTNATPYVTTFSVKTITITVIPGGQAIIGKDTLLPDQLTNELQNRLWKSYLGTGKMYNSIIIKFDTAIEMNVKESIKKAIREGQNKALTDVCLQQHKKLFEDLTSKQQERIRKEFPVLFQQDY